LISIARRTVVFVAVMAGGGLGVVGWSQWTHRHELASSDIGDQ
jgi:hypothetical protein